MWHNDAISNPLNYKKYYYYVTLIAWFWGDPHFTTLDDRGYTFNGLGEYTLIRIGNESSREFELQGRTALVNGSIATQFSAFAFGLPSQAIVEVSE